MTTDNTRKPETLDNTRAVLPGQIWRMPRVCAYLDESRSAVYRLRREDPTFPKPIAISKQTVGWLASEIIEFQTARLARLRPSIGSPPHAARAATPLPA